MNNEYIYVDEKAIIRTINEDKEPIKYYNELDKVLEQENIIEEIENKIVILESEKKETKVMSIFEAIIPNILAILSPIIAVPIISILGESIPYNTIVNTIFGSMNYGLSLTLTMASGFTVFATGFSIINLIERSKTKKHLNGIDKELKYLKRNLKPEQEKLEELIKNKNYEHANKNFRIVKINSEAIKNLNTKLKLYYSCGYNEKKYSKNFKKNKQLPKELIEVLKIGESEIVAEFLEENGPKLVKKK